MQGDSTSDTGWAFIAESDEAGTIIDTILRLDPDETYSRSELAEETGIPLKTLHLMDDVEGVVEIGLLEKHDAEGEELHYTINDDSDVFQMAEKFGRSVTAARDE